MRLFKYVPPQRVDILVNEKVVFTPPGKFSDPFEMRLELGRPARREFERQLCKQIKKQAVREIPGYCRLSARQRRIGKKDQTRGVNIGAIRSESFQAAIQRESQQIGVLCLCATEKNDLMWDFYAKGFQGFVIEFDSDNEEFRQLLGAPWKVEYMDKTPAYDYSKPTPHFFRFKRKCYEFEDEYRVVRPLYECTSGKGENDVELYFRPLSRKCVKAVYLGHRMEKSVREKILELLKGTEVQKFDVEPKQDNCELSFREIK